RVDDGELPRVPEPLQWLQPRIEAEEAIEIHRSVLAGVRPRNRDARPRAVVLRFAERHDDAEAVDRAALEDGNQLLRAARATRGKRRAREKRRREPEADESERTVFEEDTS